MYIYIYILGRNMADEIKYRQCVIIWCTRLPSPIKTDYKLNDDIIKTTNKHRYLDIILDQSMHWSHHITTMYIRKQIAKSLNFICQNLSKCDQDVKITTSLAISYMALT